MECNLLGVISAIIIQEPIRIRPTNVFLNIFFHFSIFINDISPGMILDQLLSQSLMIQDAVETTQLNSPVKQFHDDTADETVHVVH